MLERSDTLSGREQLLLTSLQRFYSGKGLLRAEVSPITGGVGAVSLRALDWLVTNFSKSRLTTYPVISALGVTSSFSVHRGYRLMLKAYTKRRPAGGRKARGCTSIPLMS